MGHDTLSSNSKLSGALETARNWMMKLRLIVPDDDETEQIHERPRQTYVPERDMRVRREAAAVSQVRRQQPMRGEVARAPRPEHRSSQVPEKKVDTAVFFVDSLISCTYAIKAVITGTSVIVHFVNTDRGTSQRIIDTLSGAAFALDAKIKKVEDNTYLIAPRGMNINVVRPSERRY